MFAIVLKSRMCARTVVAWTGVHILLKTFKFQRRLRWGNDTVKDARLPIYQESPDISGILLTSFDAQSLHPRFKRLWIDA